MSDHRHQPGILWCHRCGFFSFFICGFISIWYHAMSFFLASLIAQHNYAEAIIFILWSRTVLYCVVKKSSRLKIPICRPTLGLINKFRRRRTRRHWLHFSWQGILEFEKFHGIFYSWYWKNSPKAEVFVARRNLSVTS